MEYKKDEMEQEEGYQSDSECKRAFSFGARNFKRPPDLNIELISHEIEPAAPVSLPGNTDGARLRDHQPLISPIQPLTSPVNLQMLSPLATPLNCRSLANTPTLLSSFMNVLNKKPASEA